MSENQLKKLSALAKADIKKGISKKEALEILISAGILTPTGRHTKAYKLLGSVVTTKQ